MKRLFFLSLALTSIAQASVCSIETHQKGLKINSVTVQPLYQVLDMTVESEQECFAKAEDVHNQFSNRSDYKNTLAHFWKKHFNPYSMIKPKASSKRLFTNN
jgi:hypothetical protein